MSPTERCTACGSETKDLVRFQGRDKRLCWPCYSAPLTVAAKKVSARLTRDDAIRLMLAELDDVRSERDRRPELGGLGAVTIPVEWIEALRDDRPREAP